MFCCRHTRFNTAQVQLREIPNGRRERWLEEGLRSHWHRRICLIVSKFWGRLGFATSYATVTRVIRPWGSVALWQSLKVSCFDSNTHSFSQRQNWFRWQWPTWKQTGEEVEWYSLSKITWPFSSQIEAVQTVTLACHSSFSLHESFLLLHHPQRMAAGGIGVYRECLETSVHSVRLLWLVASGLISTLEPSSRLYPLCGACRARGIIYAGFWFCS